MRPSMPKPAAVALFIACLLLWACSPLQLQVEPAPAIAP
jgi:hypothetical protein